MAKALANPTVAINNSPIFIVPNSVVYTEGFGEQSVRVQSAGGGAVGLVSSNNVETNKSKVNFSLFPTAENIELARSWKANGDANAISITADDNFARTVNSASLINDFEVNLGADTTIDLEFEGAPAV